MNNRRAPAAFSPSTRSRIVSISLMASLPDRLRALSTARSTTETSSLSAVGDGAGGSTRQPARRAVGALDRGATFRIEKDILEVIEEFVARRALHWPRRAELLTRGQDLFHDDRKWLASLRPRRALLHLGAQSLEIA